MFFQFLLPCLALLLLSFLPETAHGAAAKKAAKETTEQTCADCHKKTFSGKFIHPAIGGRSRAEQGCSTCHVASHAKKKPERSLASPLPDLCFLCHDRGPFSKKNVHAPVAGGDCSSCHSPHSSNNPVLLREPVPFLCPTCHPDRLDGKHVLSRYGIGNVHPVQGKRDPSRPKQELVCTSCHDPHSSDQPSLFTHDSADADALCSRCHSKVTVGP